MVPLDDPTAISSLLMLRRVGQRSALIDQVTAIAVEIFGSPPISRDG